MKEEKLVKEQQKEGAYPMDGQQCHVNGTACGADERAYAEVDNNGDESRGCGVHGRKDEKDGKACSTKMGARPDTVDRYRMEDDGRAVCPICGKEFWVHGTWGYSYMGSNYCSYHCMRHVEMKDRARKGWLVRIDTLMPSAKAKRVLRMWNRIRALSKVCNSMMECVLGAASVDREWRCATTWGNALLMDKVSKAMDKDNGDCLPLQCLPTADLIASNEQVGENALQNAVRPEATEDKEGVLYTVADMYVKTAGLRNELVERIGLDIKQVEPRYKNLVAGYLSGMPLVDMARMEDTHVDLLLEKLVLVADKLPIKECA